MAENTQGNNNESKLLSDERFLRKVSYLYYENSHSQEAIAEMEYCSRQTVSKALQKAKDRGIVRITITPDLRTGYLRNLSREVRLMLDLEDLVLVPGQNINHLGADEFLEDVITEITIAAAEYLDQMLTDNDILALSGGRLFMRGLARHLKPSKPLTHMQVVPTIGFVQGHTSSGDANMIAFDVAQAYGATHHWFPCPAVLPNADLLEHTRQLPIVKETYHRMTQANVIVTGLWAAHTYGDMVIRGMLTQKELDIIESYKPVVDINHWIFDAAGRCINHVMPSFPYTLTGMDMSLLKDEIKRHRVKVILVAGGGPRYVAPIRAALKAGLANILITDHVTGQLLSN